MVDVTQLGALRGRIPANKGKSYPARALTPNEVRVLLARCLKMSSISIRHRALITVLYRTGMRAAEALALRPRDIDLEAGKIAVLRGKGGRRRTAGIDAGAIRIVEKWVTRREMTHETCETPEGSPRSGVGMRVRDRRVVRCGWPRPGVH